MDIHSYNHKILELREEIYFLKNYLKTEDINDVDRNNLIKVINKKEIRLNNLYDYHKLNNTGKTDLVSGKRVSEATNE